VKAIVAANTRAGWKLYILVPFLPLWNRDLGKLVLRADMPSRP
jgi:hypothetical protein